MSRLIRFLAITAAGGLLIAGVASGLAFVGDGILHHTATADAMPLPALGTSTLEGSTVYAADGKTVLAVLRASKEREPVPLSQVSKVLVTAVLDTEDHRFFLHGGFDIPSTIRALAADTSGSGLQGGSTIAQQLVKQTYLTSARTLSRKIKEAVLAVRLERKYSKDQILQAYLNTIYLGNGAYGVEAAANMYFGVHASQITLPEAALLAGLIQNPSGYDPILRPELARTRRGEVLDRMQYYSDITRAEEAAANATPLPTAVVQPPVAGNDITDYYVQEVKDELLASGSPLGSTYDERYQALFEGGLKIYTNLDPRLQAATEQAVAHGTPPNSKGFEEAMVAIDPATGQVKAMVGGAGFEKAHYDVITQGRRQPGSGFKIFTLLAALEKGYSIYDTVDGQAPCAINFPTDHDLVTHPARNDEGPGGGVGTVLNATALSINCAYIRLAHEVGLPNVVAMAHRLGVTENLPLYPSIVIGSIPVHPIEMAAAYATMADDGVYHKPTFISRVVDRTGTTIYTGASPGQRVVPSQIVREANVAFQAVVQYGTGTGAALYNRPAAGKTGTTDSTTDAWFNGFTPQLEATVWMGNPSGDVPMVDVGGFAQVYGGTFPAETWRFFMSDALAGAPALGFSPPNYSILPAPHYITSPSLVRDDVLDHNQVYVPSPAPPPASPPSTAPPVTGGGPGSGPQPPNGAPGHGHGNGQ
ncbi:MAG: transglycosylase domain-containing protein [Acidimicrobiales bacterium]